MSDEERVRLTARIAELTTEATAARALERQLVGECKGVKAALQKAQFARKALEERVGEVQGSIDEALIGVRAGEEALRKAVLEKEDALVNYDLLRVEVKRLRDALSVRTEEVLSLENRAAQLELTMEARKREVEGARAVARMEAKLAEEERHALARDFSDRSAKIALLKTRYEVLCARLRGGGGGEGGEEGGEPVSQAYYVLKAAQKREELQREGDELEAACTKREKEVKALEHTLAYLNARNDAFRTAFAGVDPGGSEVGAVRALEGAVGRVAESLFKAKKGSERAGGSIAEAQRRVGALRERREALEAMERDTRAAFDRAVQDKAVALGVARDLEGRLTACRARLRGGGAGGAVGGDELAINSQALRDAANSALFLLGQLGFSMPQLGASVSAAVKERGLRIPARPIGRSGVGASSSGSSGSGVEDLLAIVSATSEAPPPPPSASTAPSSSSSSAFESGSAVGSSARAPSASPSVAAVDPFMRGGGGTTPGGGGMPFGSGDVGGGLGGGARAAMRAPSPMTVPSTAGSKAQQAAQQAQQAPRQVVRRPPLAAKPHQQESGKGKQLPPQAGGVSLGVVGHKFQGMR